MKRSQHHDDPAASAPGIPSTQRRPAPQASPASAALPVTLCKGKTTIFSWKNYGKSPFFMEKLWKSTIFHGKTTENHYF